MSILRLVLIGIALLVSSSTWAACTKEGQQESCNGTGSADQSVLFVTADADLYDTCSLVSSDGSVEVQVTIDGTNWSTAVALEAQGVEDIIRVLATVADQLYWFGVKAKYIRVRQVGATATTAAMRCWDQ